MKKLLALILCVMMLVSVIPTMAFAEEAAAAYKYGDEAGRAYKGEYASRTSLISLETAKSYSKMIENVIKNTKTDIEDAYKVLAGNQVVYGSIEAMDKTVVGLVDGIADALIEKGKFTKGAADNVKSNLRLLVDDMVSTEIAKNYNKMLDKDGNIDPLKRAEVYAKAVNTALTDKDFQKGYEAVATYFAMRQVISDINDALDDEYTAFIEKIDSDFDAKFAARYPDLANNWIETITEATSKNGAWTKKTAAGVAAANAEKEYDEAVKAAIKALPAGYTPDQYYAAIDSVDRTSLDAAYKALSEATTVVENLNPWAGVYYAAVGSWS